MELKRKGIMDEKYCIYIGTKAVAAKPMDNYGEPGYEVVYQDGYKSWSPKKTFEDSYRKAEDMGVFTTSFQGLMR